MLVPIPDLAESFPATKKSPDETDRVRLRLLHAGYGEKCLLGIIVAASTPARGAGSTRSCSSEWPRNPQPPPVRKMEHFRDPAGIFSLAEAIRERVTNRGGSREEITRRLHRH